MLPSGTYNTTYDQRMAIIRTNFQWLLLVAFVLSLLLLPLFASGYWLTFLIYCGITIVSVLGLNLLSGYCGQFSIGHAAFMGVGAFTCAHLVNAGIPFLIAAPAAAIVSGVSGVVFGLPTRKLKGLYLALSTLAAQFIITYFLVKFAGGDVTVYMPPPKLAGIALDTPFKIYYLVIISVILATFFAKNIARTKVGRAFVAIRDNEVAAGGMGINVFGYKLLAFFIGCFYAGFAGALLATFIGVASVEHYTLFDSIWYLGITIVGGFGTVTGSIFGTIFIRGLNDITSILAPKISQAFPILSANTFLSLPIILFSLVIIAFLIFEPRGLAHRWEIVKTSMRLWPFAYR